MCSRHTRKTVRALEVPSAHSRGNCPLELLRFIYLIWVTHFITIIMIMIINNHNNNLCPLPDGGFSYRFKTAAIPRCPNSFFAPRFSYLILSLFRERTKDYLQVTKSLLRLNPCRFKLKHLRINTCTDDCCASFSWAILNLTLDDWRNNTLKM